MTIRITQIGPGSSLQDQGRIGWQRYGVSGSGPMDWMAARFANMILDNDPKCPVIEVDQFGLHAIAEAECNISIIAPGGTANLNGDDIDPSVRLSLKTGDTFTLAPQKGGGWAYLAIVGGFDGREQLGSVSYHLRSGMGGPKLTPGNLLVGHGTEKSGLEPAAFPLFTTVYDSTAKLRLIRGPQDEMISPDALAGFLNGQFTLSLQCDRMGYRLQGEPLTHKDGADIVSDGIAMGAIQVPGDGNPIILMADRQTAGGYPKLGVIISADLPKLAQRLIGPNAPALHFEPVNTDYAIKALKDAYNHLNRAANTPVPVGPRTLTTDLLMQHNLIDGVHG